MVPHSLSHFDGSMISNSQKGELTTMLLSKIPNQDANSPDRFEVDIIDGFYLLQCFKELCPNKYGHFATYLLNNLCNTTASEVHIIFSKRDEGSPRDVCIKKQSELYDSFGEKNFIINGPNQERKECLTKCLANENFRVELVKFIIDYCKKDEISNHSLD